MVYGRRRGGMDRRNRSEPVRGNFGERDSALREAAARRRLAGGELGQLELERLELAVCPSGWTRSTLELARLVVWARGWTISTRSGLRLLVLVAIAALGARVVLEVGVAVCDEIWQAGAVCELRGLRRSVGRFALLLAGRHRLVMITKRAGQIIAFWVRPK